MNGALTKLRGKIWLPPGQEQKREVVLRTLGPSAGSAGQSPTRLLQAITFFSLPGPMLPGNCLVRLSSQNCSLSVQSAVPTLTPGAFHSAQHSVLMGAQIETIKNRSPQEIFTKIHKGEEIHGRPQIVSKKALEKAG